MADEAPEPLVPADVDLRGLEYMPFFGNHLFGSEFNARCTDAEWRAGLTLWWAAWNQVPAGSLPNDDAALARLADLGRDVRGWKRVKVRALHGFVLCNDGRLYHKFIARQALVAWEKRVKEREKKRRWREAKDRDKSDGEPGQERGQDGSNTRDKQGDGTADGTRRDVTGRDGTLSKTESEKQTSPAVAIAVALRAAGVADASLMHPQVQEWAEAGVTVEEAKEAARIAVEVRKNPKPKVRYLVGIIEDMRKPPKPLNGHGKPWFIQSWTAIVTKGAELGIEQSRDESDPDYRARVFAKAGITSDDVNKAQREWQ